MEKENKRTIRKREIFIIPSNIAENVVSNNIDDESKRPVVILKVSGNNVMFIPITKTPHNSFHYGIKQKIGLYEKSYLKMNFIQTIDMEIFLDFGKFTGNKILSEE